MVFGIFSPLYLFSSQIQTTLSIKINLRISNTRIQTRLLLQGSQMIVLDTILFVTITGLMHLYKQRNPNFLFFPKSAVLFLPPGEDLDVKGKGKSKNSTQHEIHVLQTEYSQIKSYPFCTEHERVVMSLFAMAIHLALRFALSTVISLEFSQLPFYLLVVLFIYSVKNAVDIFIVSAYKTTGSFTVAIVLNAVIFASSFIFGDVEGVYDQSLTREANDYSKYLEILFGNNQMGFINRHTVMFFVVFVNFFVTLAAIPTVIKFGNWYTKTLKEVYYQSEEESGSDRPLLVGQQESRKQMSEKVKSNSKSTVRLLNIYLVLVLAFCALSHGVCRVYLQETIIDVLRILVLVMAMGIILWTMKDAIEFNGSFAYRYVTEYFQTKDVERKQQLRRLIVPYITQIWYHFYQFMTRFIIPVVLFLLLINWKYLSVDVELKPQSENDLALGFQPQVECSFTQNQLDSFKNIYRCPLAKPGISMEQEKFLTTYHTVSSRLKGLPPTLTPAQLQKTILKYGLLRRSFMIELCELLLWYGNLTIYLLTVVYIVFLRKTVYEI